MTGIIKGTIFIVCLLLFIAPVATPPGLRLPGDPTEPACAQIPLLPEYFSIKAIPPVPTPLIDFASFPVGPADPLAAPPRSENDCDTCSAAIVEPMRMAIETTLPAAGILEPIPTLLPELEGRLWIKAELTRIFDPDPWHTYRYLEEMAESPTFRGQREKKAGREILNAFYVKIEEGEERRKIREKWTQTFGIDVWYPYFKAKEVERWVKERISFRIRKLKCKPRFERGLARYICEKRF